MMNSKYRVLLLSPFFFPEQISTGKYNSVLAEALVEQGCHVSVITSHPLYPKWIPIESSDALSGAEIYRAGLNVSYPKSAILRRFVLEIWFIWHVTITYLKIGKNFFCIVPIFPPSLFFLLLTKIAPRKIKRVGIVHDLQGVYVSRSQNILSKMINYAIHGVEKRCFESCDKIIFLSNSMAKRAIEDYKLNPKSCVVCYPFRTVLSEPCDVGDALVDLFPENKIHVVYSGALGEKQNPVELFHFLNAVASENSDIFCHIFSGGPMFERLKANYANSSENKVYFHDLVPIEHLNELYARSDVQVIPQAFGTSEGSLPSKLPNLLAAGVSIFAICETGSELGILVEEAGAGHVTYTWEQEKIVHDFIKFLDNVRTQSHISRRALMSDFINQRFSVKNVVVEIIGSNGSSI